MDVLRGAKLHVKRRDTYDRYWLQEKAARWSKIFLVLLGMFVLGVFMFKPGQEELAPFIKAETARLRFAEKTSVGVIERRRTKQNPPAQKPRETKEPKVVVTTTTKVAAATTSVRKTNSATPTYTPRPVPPMSSGVKILHIGDSHSAGGYGYGPTLSKLFTKSNAEIVRVAYGGANACVYMVNEPGCNETGWIRFARKRSMPQLRTLLSRHNPNLVIISLGSNHAHWWGHRQVKTMTDLLKGRKCYWVGPPNTFRLNSVKPRKAFYDKLPSLVGHCKLIDSRKLIKYNWCGDRMTGCKTNGHLHARVHYPEGMNAAKGWARGVFDIIHNDLTKK